MTNYILLGSCLLGAVPAAYGQYAVSGKVLDKQTHQPVPYASVRVAGTTVGTTSNADGEFALTVHQVPAKLLANSLGYGRDSAVIAAAGPMPALTLLATPVQLPDAKPTSYVAELLAKAYQQVLRTNDQAEYGQAFYRQITRIDEVPTEVQEAVWNVKTNSTGISGSLLAQGRFAAKPALMNFTNFSVYTKLFRKTWVSTGPDTATSHALLSPHSGHDYNLRLKGLTQSNGQSVAEIAFERKPETKLTALRGSIYIDTDTYQVLHVQATMPMSSSSNKRAYTPKNGDLTFDLDLKPQADAAAPTYLRVSCVLYLSQPRKPDAKVQASSFTYFYNAQPTPTSLAYTTDGQANDLEAIKKQPYDPAFWRDNPVVKRTPLEEETIRAFEQQNAFGTMLAK
ncbi:MAG: carboxypeptidase-like regulatory domain-containing protein [Janthinobacterium lividum]